MSARFHIAACVLVAGLGGIAHADEGQSSGHAVEGELGLVVAYSNADIISLGGMFGFTFGKPILNAFYVEPVLDVQYSLFNAGRLTALLRCNFIASVGVVFSVGVGAGTGWKTVTDDNFDSHQLSRDHRVVEVALKKGGKRRFLVGLGLAFDKDEMGVESKAIMLQTTLIKAGP